MRYIDRSLQPVVQRFLSANERLSLTYGTRHARVVHSETHDFVLIAGSASDWRTRSNLESSLRRLSQTGCGLIASKTRRWDKTGRTASHAKELSHA